MPFSDLYEFSQELDIKVRRKIIKEELIRLTGKNKIAMAVSGSLDPKICRGLYLSIKSEHIWAQQHGCDVVVISRQIRDTNYCWDRFVTVKEMMHIFDSEVEACDTGDKFDTLIGEFCSGALPELSPQMTSEVKCFWRALSVLCPERKRLDFKTQVAAGKLNHYDVALKLRIPEQYVPQLLHERYDRILPILLNDELVVKKSPAEAGP